MSLPSDLPRSDWVANNASAFAAWAEEPNHIIVAPRREISSWLDALPDERDDLWQLLREARDLCRRDPDTAVHVSFEDGRSGDHLTIHVSAESGSHPSQDSETGASDTEAELAVQPDLVDSLDGRFLRLELIRCLIDQRFDRIDLLVSFVMKSGLALLADRLETALERGASVRILTTDYQHITDADALARLLDMAESSAQVGNSMAVRVFSDPLTSFHPKAYLFHSSQALDARGFVGSNNLSRSGIDAGVEWSLGTRDVAPLVASFDTLWGDARSQPLSHEWLRTYRQAWRPTAGDVVPIGVETEAPDEAPSPRSLQAEALEALTGTRSEGFAAGMVVMATGLGKTWLAAFDSTAGFGRTLFVAHREEILRQSRDVFRQVRPDAELGLFMGAEKQPDADVVFASVQTLTRHLDSFGKGEFDYIVVDEFHHASANSYRRILEHFDPRFLLGLTATPERMDGADLLALCGDNLVFECGLVEGIDRDELVPFLYWGIKDVADYEGIPWRSGRFDADQLAERIETQQRAQQAFEEWTDRCGERTLAFCASVDHAKFMRDYFRNEGVATLAVHSSPGSADRREALDQLRSGDVEVVFAVDMFNEGVDVPEIDSVLMLRPTDSPVVFLQQLGRGLRLSENKDHLRVIDFVGNHRSFLLHPRVLLGMSGDTEPTNLRVMQALQDGEWDLPAGCSVTFDVEAIDLLRSMAEQRMAVGDALEQFCVDFAAEHETRPSAAQAAASGYNPTSAKRRHGSWFGLLDDLDLLEDIESDVWSRYGDTLKAFETETVTKSYKLVALKALLSAGTLRSGIGVSELAERSQQVLAGDPRLIRDTESKAMPSPATAEPRSWERFWRKWPLDHLARAEEGALFRYDGNRFVPTFAVDTEFGDAFDAMVAELVEWRLGDYLLRSTPTSDGAIRCPVSHSSGNPIVRFDRSRHPDLPVGNERFIADDTKYVGRFVKIALNVATRPDHDANVLPQLLRRWFGPDAGHPGTRHAVLLEHTSDGWTMAPESLTDGNPLSEFVGQRFKRQDVPPLFGVEYNPGNWNSGHVSLPHQRAVVLFVTLTKSDHMTHGSEYKDFFESPEVFVWSSQASVGPDSKKGREILEAEEHGTSIHLFTREKKADVAFTYRGLVGPLSHDGDRPMSVRFSVKQN